ncbi:Fructose-bisphosphate aldolase class 1 [Thalassocella blandensis]|nr:Fructose-bisphosphate aldolase class 1 [Thalassocella blandensis]
MLRESDVNVPADVPADFRSTYVNNFLKATRNTGRLMMFAGDQKIEHLNDDFFGKTDLGEIAEEDHSPDHLFHIASKGTIGVFAAQLGLISMYGKDFPDINYMVKLNSKSNLIKLNQQDPLSQALWDIDDVVALKENSGLNIVGVGYTCYLGSEYEGQMLAEAAKLIQQAHAKGLLTCVWMYPRGKAVSDEKSGHLIAGAAGVAACLGTDFVKVNYPHEESGQNRADTFKEAIWAAGRAGVICAGGGSTSALDLLQQIYDQMHVSGARGNATGRNIHQRDLDQAVALCDAISSITLGNKDVAFAERVYKGQETFSL